MRVEEVTTDYNITFGDREIKVLIECLKNSATSLFSARDKSLAIDLLGELKELFPNEDIEQNHDIEYINQYLDGVKCHLRIKYNISPEIVDSWLDKLREHINDDPEYVFHYNAEYWADFMVEASGEIMPKKLRFGVIEPKSCEGFPWGKNDESPYQGIFDFINKATVVSGEYADEIREEILRKPSESALDRNKRAQELLRKLRGN